MSSTNIIVKGYHINIEQTIRVYLSKDCTPTIYDMINYINSIKNKKQQGIVVIIYKKDVCKSDNLSDYSCYLINDILDVHFRPDRSTVNKFTTKFPKITNFISYDCGIFQDTCINYDLYMV